MGNYGLIGAFSSKSGLADTVMTTNGDIVYYNSGRQRLAKSDNDKILTLKSGLPSWEAAGGGATVESDHATITSASTTTNTSMTASSLNITIGNISNGKSLITATLVASRSTAGGTEFSLADDGTVIVATWVAFDQTASDSKVVIPLSYVMDSNGSVLTVYFMTGGGTVSIAGSSSEFTSQLMALNVG